MYKAENELINSSSRLDNSTLRAETSDVEAKESEHRVRYSRKIPSAGVADLDILADAFHKLHSGRILSVTPTWDTYRTYKLVSFRSRRYGSQNF